MMGQKTWFYELPKGEDLDAVSRPPVWAKKRVRIGARGRASSVQNERGKKKV